MRNILSRLGDILVQPPAATNWRAEESDYSRMETKTVINSSEEIGRRRVLVLQGHPPLVPPISRHNQDSLDQNEQKSLKIS